MKELQLIDRVVVEIKGEDGFNLTPDQLKNMLQFIAYKITNEGQKGGEFTDKYDGPEFEVLFERECPNYGGFRMGEKSLICQHYYGSEKKPKKYILIAHNYDRENSSAYPVGGIFATEGSAKEYLRTHIDEIKSNHWTADRVDGEDRYSEEFTDTGWHAEDWDDGASLELEIHEMEDEL